MAFRLTITSGKEQGREFYFTQDVVRLGRVSDNDLVLYEPGVSRYHCEILKDPEHYTLHDVGSSNGTMLNNVLTTEAVLAEGDHIQVGPITFRFHEAAEVPESRRRLTGEAAIERPENTEVRRGLEADKTQTLTRAQLAALRAQGEGGVLPVEVSPDARATIEAPVAAYEKVRRLVAARAPGRRMLAAASVASIVAIAVSAWWLRAPRDRSSEVFALTAENAARRYGAGKVDIHTPDRVAFSFDYQGGGANLMYTGGGIDSDAEVQIALNGQAIGHMQVAGAWTSGFRLRLPRRLLVPGANVVSFDNVRVPGAAERWGVSHVQVVQAPLLSPDPERAKQLLDLGLASFDTRNVTPQNLYKAIGYYQEAVLHLEAFDEPPAMVADIEQARVAAERELQAVHDNLVFAARRAERFGNRAEAVETLRRLLTYYPDASDRRHQEVKRMLAELVGHANR